MSKVIDWSKYPNFSAEEFRCKHTGLDGIQAVFMDRLQLLRRSYGKPMRISSGFRHPTHPIEAKKSKPGPHSTGLACDVLVSGNDAYDLIEFAIAHGFNRIGVNQKGPVESRFIHLDCCPASEGFASPTVWSY